MLRGRAPPAGIRKLRTGMQHPGSQLNDIEIPAAPILGGIVSLTVWRQEVYLLRSGAEKTPALSRCRKAGAGNAQGEKTVLQPS